MKEIFVVHGRTEVSNGIYDVRQPDDEYEDDAVEEVYFDSFSKVLDVFESFDAAFAKFQCYVKEAFENVQNAHPIALDPARIKEACGVELFENYNQDAYGYGEAIGDIRWTYACKEGENAHWQMYAVVPDMSIGCPILPGIHLEKKKLNP